MIKHRGFTLLELLIAMTLLGLVLVVMYSSLNISMRGWDKGSDRTEIVNELRLVQEFIRTQLRQSITVYQNDPVEGRVIFFDGKKDTIGWVAPMLTFLGRGGLYFVQLDIVEEQDNDVLRLSWYPYHPDLNEDNPPDPDSIEETVLLSRIESFSLSYFGAEEVGEDPEWFDDWESLLERPQLVRMEITTPDIDWPPLVVALAN